MKSSPLSDTALVAVAAPPRQGGRGNGTRPRGKAAAPASRAFMPRRAVLGTGVVLLAGAAMIATAGLFALSLLLSGAADLARWALSSATALPAWDAARVLGLLEASGVCGLACGAIACALFLRDLLRQRWL